LVDGRNKVPTKGVLGDNNEIPAMEEEKKKEAKEEEKEEAKEEEKDEQEMEEEKGAETIMEEEAGDNMSSDTEFEQTRLHGTFATSQKSACYPNNIFPLIRGHSHNYTSVLIEDWMIFHYMLSTIQMLQENGFKTKVINITNSKVWHSTKRCFNNTLKSMEK